MRILSIVAEEADALSPSSSSRVIQKLLAQSLTVMAGPQLVRVCGDRDVLSSEDVESL